MKEEEAIQMLADPQKRRKAFEWMVGQYSQQLYWKIRRIVLTHDDADDVLQNTFIKAWTHLDDFRQKSKLSTWLYRIAVNEALDFLRRQKTMAGTMTDVQMPVDDGGEHSPSVFDRLMADEYLTATGHRRYCKNPLPCCPTCSVRCSRFAILKRCRTQR